MTTLQEDFDKVLSYVSDTLGGGFPPHPDDELSDGRSVASVASRLSKAWERGHLTEVAQPGMMVVDYVATNFGQGCSVYAEDFVTDTDTVETLLEDHFRAPFPPDFDAERDLGLVMACVAASSRTPNVPIRSETRIEDGRRLGPLVDRLLPDDGPTSFDDVASDVLWTLHHGREGDGVLPGAVCNHGTIAQCAQDWMQSKSLPTP